MKLHLTSQLPEDLGYFVTLSSRKTLASIYPSNCTDTIHSLIYPYIILLSTHLSNHLPYMSIHLFIHPSFNLLFTHVSVHLSTCRSTCPSVHPSFYPFIYPSNHLFIHHSIIYLSICLFTHDSLSVHSSSRHIFSCQSIHPAIHPASQPVYS